MNHIYADYLIIGTSAAGFTAVKTLINEQPTASIAWVTKEEELSYNKCFLADYISKQREYASLFIGNSSLFAHPQLTLMRKTIIDTLNPAARTATTTEGIIIQYTRTLIATGSKALIPPIPGIQLDGVFGFHTLQDITAIEQYINDQHVKTVAVIGAGLTGLECADALLQRGMKVILIDRGAYPLASFCTQSQAQPIVMALTRHTPALTTYWNTSVAAIQSNDGIRVHSVQLCNGTPIPVDMIIYAIGVTPNMLGQTAGLQSHGNHLAVSCTLQTSDPHIYAAGDSITLPYQFTGILTPSCTWPDALRQGMVAAQAMIGKKVAYATLIPFVVSHFFGISVGASAPCMAYPVECTALEVLNDDGTLQVKWYLHNQFVGFTVIGTIEQRYPLLRRELLTGNMSGVI